MRKTLSKITRSEWITCAWFDTGAIEDGDRVFMADFKRAPDEAAQAALDWDATVEAREEAKDIEL